MLAHCPPEETRALALGAELGGEALGSKVSHHSAAEVLDLRVGGVGLRKRRVSWPRRALSGHSSCAARRSRCIARARVR